MKFLDYFRKKKKFLLLFVLTVFLSYFCYSCDREKTVVVNFYDGKTELDSIKITYGNNVEVPLEPTSDQGKTFNGWYLDEELTKPFNFCDVIESNLNLYAAWTLNDYSIVVHNDDNDIEYIYNYNDIIRLDSLEKEDYVFKGYYYDEDLTKRFDLVTMPAKNIELYAKFDKVLHYYSFVYHTNSEQSFDSNTLEFSDLNTLVLPQPEREGYTFDGWYLDDKLTDSFDLTKANEGINELYAKWIVNDYTITVHNNNETIECKFKYNDVIKLDNLEKDDYTFAGYYYDEELTKKFDLVTMPAKNIELYAKFDKVLHYYSFVYHTNNEQSFDSNTLEFSDLNTLVLPQPEREGYTFDGWYLDDKLTDSFDLTKANEGINELYAKWIVNDYTITVHNNNETIECKFKYNDVIKLDNLEKDDYTFAGYYYDEELTKKFDLVLMPSNDIELYAKYTRLVNYYNVEYKVDNDKGYIIGASKQNIKENGSSSEIEVKALDGYRFIGWDDGKTEAKRSDVVFEETTYVAQFERIFKLSILNSNPDYGYLEGETTQYLTEGEESSSVKAIPNLGYKFKFWSNDRVKDNISLTITEDTILYANFGIDYLELPVMEIYTENRKGILSKEEYIKCNISLSNAEYEYTFDYKNADIRLRGNESLNYPKKPYRIKFDKKVDLFGNGEAKKWNLIAEYKDPSFSRNKLSYSIGELLDISNVTSTDFVDLFVNGEYVGMYLVTEQIEVGNNRVEIEENYADVNTGYLIELDGYALDDGIENFSFFEFNNQYYTIKSPDTENEKYNSSFCDFIKKYISDSYSAILTKDFELIKTYIDVESFAKTYIINEINKNVDVQWSSWYLYKDKNGLLVSGPLWDYDMSFGSACYAFLDGFDSTKYDSIYAIENVWYQSLLEIDEFKDLVSNILNEKYNDIISMTNSVLISYNSLRNSINRNFLKWDVLGKQYSSLISDKVWKLDSYEKHIDYVKDFLLKSLDYIYNYYVNPGDSAYSITIDNDEHSDLLIYNTNDYKYGTIVLSSAWSRNLSTGNLLKDGTGCIAFKLLLDDGYEIDSITINDNSLYDELIVIDEDNHLYRINGIKGNIEVSITTKENIIVPGPEPSFNISFNKDEHIQIMVYDGQDYSIDGTMADSWDLLDVSGDGQVNFKILLEEGYTLNSINITGSYNKLKDQDNNIYRITKITSDLVVNVTAKKGD